MTENQCACSCHTGGIKHYKTMNPPQPCCNCDSFSGQKFIPVEQKSDVQILLERIEKLEKLEESHVISWGRLTEDCREYQHKIDVVHDATADFNSKVWDRIEKLEENDQEALNGLVRQIRFRDDDIKELKKNKESLFEILNKYLKRIEKIEKDMLTDSKFRQSLEMKVKKSIIENIK